MQSLRYPFATLLEQAHFESEHHFDADEIRILLANHAPQESIVLYGGLLRQLLSRIKSDVIAQPGDAELLLGYCAATLELPIDLLFESYEFDGEEAFRGAVYHSDKYENPIHQGLEFCRFFSAPFPPKRREKQLRRQTQVRPNDGRFDRIDYA